MTRALCYLARDGPLTVSRRYAYVEFTEPNLVAQALVLNESLFRGRNLKVEDFHLNEKCQSLANNVQQVVPKRTNLPGLTRGGRGGGRGVPRGRGGFGRGGYGPPRGAYRGGFRGRGRGYAPY